MRSRWLDIGQVLFCVIMHQTNPAAPSPWGTFAYLVSPGGGALSNFAWPGGSGICPPRAFDTYYVDFDSNITKRGGFYWKLDINKEIGRLAHL